MKIKKEDIIYTAGFFDGEGYVGVGWKNRIEIRIVNTDKNVIKYLHSLWGGIIYKRKIKKNHTQMYDLVIVGKAEVQHFIRRVAPFSRIKIKTIGQLYSPEELELIKVKEI